MPDVRLVNVSKKFGKIMAVDNVSLHIRDKEYFSILGPSGCGKTTLLRLIAGLIRPDEGEIYIGERLVNDVPPEDRDIGFVFQTFALFPHMNVWDNVTYGPRVKGFDMKRAEIIGYEVLDMVKLYERLDAYPNELSGGMMQRIAVARALAAGAKLLLLDEPLGHLDARVRNELRYEIRRMVKDLGLTAIHVTHDQAEAMAISDRIAVMKKGKVVQVGSPQELYLHPKSLFVAHFLGEANFLEGYITEAEDETVTVELRGGLKIKTHGKDMKAGEKVVLAIRPETLILARESKIGSNTLRGIVEKLTFEGPNVRYEIKLENDESIIAVTSSLKGRWFKIGDKVTLTLKPEKIRLFKYPETGLREEISLE